MEVIDEGHGYEFRNLDGEGVQRLYFVKRQGENYPFNESAYEGITSQLLIRALLNRARYVQKQKPNLENWLVILLQRCSLWLLEFRAARRHHILYLHTLNFAEFAPLCSVCAHTVCKH